MIGHIIFIIIYVIAFLFYNKVLLVIIPLHVIYNTVDQIRDELKGKNNEKKT